MTPICSPSTTTSARLTRCNRLIIAEVCSRQRHARKFALANLHHHDTGFNFEAFIADHSTVDTNTALLHHAQSFRRRRAQIGLFEQLSDSQRRTAQADFWYIVRNTTLGTVDEIGQRLFCRLWRMEACDDFLAQCHLDIAWILAPCHFSLEAGHF